LLDQRLEIERLDWDYLIILDACRADYFEECNKIQGKYERAISPASETLSWLIKTFPHFYNVTFYSSNPFVNSKTPIRGYDARKHFARIIDVWDFGWDDNLSTIPPQEVYWIASMAKPKSIIWFIQPHLPAIGKIKLIPKWSKEVFKKGWGGDTVIIQQVQRGEIAPEKVREAYKENLIYVLKWVKRLIDNLQGKIIITADHGEFLGEKGLWLHSGHIRHPVLNQVPWLEV